MSNFTNNFTKVVRSVGLFMLKKNLDLFFRCINTPSRNPSVKVEDEERRRGLGGFQTTHRLKMNQLMIFGFICQKIMLRLVLNKALSINESTFGDLPSEYVYTLFFK